MAEQIRFNLDEIPQWQVNALCKEVHAMTERLFSDPEEEARFQEWKQEREKKRS